jgi:hypothetical protein
VVGQYASNPALLAVDQQSEANAALTVNLPLNYDLDDFHFVATPNVRYGNATGYSSLTSNTFHLDSSAQLANDLGSTTVTGALYRDSSLLYAGELANGIGVRRDTASVDLNWQRALSERVQVQLDLNGVRTLYAQNDEPSGTLSSLVDYRYGSFSPAIGYSLSERNTLRVIGSVGRYQAINGLSASDSVSLQLGFDRQLSEMWALKTTAGYSKANDKESFYFHKFLLGNVATTQNSTVYSANLVRQGELATLTFGASRALAPTGFAYLSRQQTVDVLAKYMYSERWTFNASINWQTNTNPPNGNGSAERQYYFGSFSANWHWTEQWMLTLQAIKVTQRYGEPASSSTSNGLSLQIAKQFYRTDL